MKKQKSTTSKKTDSKGGETHQLAAEGMAMTTQQGVIVSDDQNSLKLGERGPTLMEDQHLREKLFHFDHERIPERVVHARGYGAHGYFQSYESLSDLTMAEPFQKANQKTPVFVRFSTVAGNKGSPDLARDVRGFATKFYTQAGNWDLVGNNIPVFFIQDAIKFPDLIHSVKPAPDRGFPQAQSAHDNFWDFISLSPEAMNMVMWVMSDRAIPRSFRFMEGFGIHSFRLVNSSGKSTYVKFHWKPKQGMQSVLWNEALKINGADPDFHRRDLWDAIQNGDFPEWELGVQLFDDKFADKFPFDILDPTKIIPEEVIPVKLIGKMVLNKCVDNFFAETEQVAFCTQNVIPGIDFTNDPLLQGRNFSYLDTQLKRLGGPNFTHIPINAPKVPVRNYQQDGHMAMHNPKGRVNYEPNSWDEDSGPRETPEGFKSFPAKEEGQKMRVRSETFSDHYSQAIQFYKSQTVIEQEHLKDALVFELSKVKKIAIREKMVGHLLNIDNDLAKKVSVGLGLDKLPPKMKAAREPKTDLKISDALSILKNPPKDFKGRKIGILLSKGHDHEVLENLLNTLMKGKVNHEIISFHSGEVKSKGKSSVKVDEKIDGAPSVLYDAVVLMISDDELQTYLMCPAARDFVSDAMAHKKFIGFHSAGEELLKKLSPSGELDEGMIKLDSAGSVKKFLSACKDLRFWERM